MEKVANIRLRYLDKFNSLQLVASPPITTTMELSSTIEDVQRCGWFIYKKTTDHYEKLAVGSVVDYFLRGDNLKKDCVLVNSKATCILCRKYFFK